MPHACQMFIASALEALRKAELSGPAKSDTRMVPGIYPSWDTAEGELTLGHASQPGGLITLEAQLSAPPRWFTFNLDLGPDSFAPGDVLGLVAELDGSEEQALEMFVRSITDKGSADTTLQDPLRVPPARGIVTALHTVQSDDPICRAQRFHTLAIRLPKRDFRITLHDLKLFVIPAERGLRSTPADLASAAG